MEILYELENTIPEKIFETDGVTQINDLQRIYIIWGRFEQSVYSNFGISADILRSMLTRLNRTGLYETFTGMYLGYKGGKGSTTTLYEQFRKWTILNEKNSDFKANSNYLASLPPLA